MAKVEKLKYYRRLEEQRQKILKDDNLMAEEVKQQAEQDVVMIDTSINQQSIVPKKAAVDSVKTRNEAIAEQRFVRDVISRNSRGGKLSKDQRRQLREKVLQRLIEAKDEIRKNCPVEIRYKTVDGK